MDELELRPHPCIAPENISYLFVNRGFYSRNEIGYQEEIEKAIDCEENEELFLAIAALRNDTDKEQWFAHNNYEYLTKCLYDKFHYITFRSFNVLDYVNLKDEFHKAPVEELIKYFKDK